MIHAFTRPFDGKLVLLVDDEDALDLHGVLVTHDPEAPFADRLMTILEAHRAGALGDRFAEEPEAFSERVDDPDVCGHTASGNGFTFVCDLPRSHPTRLHRQRTQLRDSVSVTNWGDDGLAPHATKDPRR